MIKVDKILKDFSGKSPLFPLPNFVLFPLAGHRFKIFETRYVQMLESIIDKEKLITISLLKPGYEDDYENNPDLNSIGTLGYVDQCKELPDNQYEIIIFGLKLLCLFGMLRPNVLGDFRLYNIIYYII